MSTILTAAAPLFRFETDPIAGTVLISEDDRFTIAYAHQARGWMIYDDAREDTIGPFAESSDAINHLIGLPTGGAL